MKNHLLLYFLIIPFLSLAELRVQLSYCTFYHSSSGPYTEVYLSFQPSDIDYIKTDYGYVGEIEVKYNFVQEAELISKVFMVETPSVQDTISALPAFVVQHRIPLKNGQYKMSTEIRDIHKNSEPVKAEVDISLNYNEELLALSDIEIFQSAETSDDVNSMFYKNGYKIVPYNYDILPVGLNQIGFYAELYNANKTLGNDSAFLITYYLEDYETGEMIPGFRGFSRKKAHEKNVIMGKFLVGSLSGGNYIMKVDVYNRDNKLLTSKEIAFHKENPVILEPTEITGSFVDRYKNADSLAQHIEYLQPISDQLEWEFAENQLSKKDLELMKKYFLNFWQKRDAVDPEYAWYAYLQEVKITNENFGTPMLDGYLTDRGYRYLKYGKPDDRFESFDEPRAFPYEIWMYNKVNRQSNRMIVFANKTAVLNDFTILHSNINGELYNKNWQMELNRVNPGVTDEENPEYQDHFGSKSRLFLNLPRQ